MSKLDDKWERIVKKVHLILEKNKKLEEAQGQLLTQIKSFEQQISELNNQNHRLEEQIQYIKAAKEVRLSEKERVQTKKQIKQFMDEIDEMLANVIN
jgi:predicted  nucleic acid-binding Zn-ribbon protein